MNKITILNAVGVETCEVGRFNASLEKAVRFVKDKALNHQVTIHKEQQTGKNYYTLCLKWDDKNLYSLLNELMNFGDLGGDLPSELLFLEIDAPTDFYYKTGQYLD